MALGSPTNGPAKAPLPREHAPAGRLRLAAALGGAGLLAAGFGSGIVQSQAQEAAGAPGEDAVAGAQPAATTAAPAPAPAAQTSTPVAKAASAPATTATAPPAQGATNGTSAPAAQPAASTASETGRPAPAAAAAQPEQSKPADDADKADEDDQAEPAEDCATPRAELPEEEEDDDAAKARAAACDDEDATYGKPKRKGKDTDRDAKPGRRGSTTRTPIDRTPQPPVLRAPSGVPTVANPTTSLAVPGPAAVGVPNFFIDKFRIPPFLLSIYQAAGVEYGIRWEILAAINEIETDYGRNLNVSSAGALGWMQFMPATWRAYGVDANGDGTKDPYNPVDAIFAAARYLKASGGETDLRKAIFAYNHADWYVDSVLMRARLVGGLPPDLVGSLTGLTEGRFPLAGRARYADDLSEREVNRKVARGTNAAISVGGDSDRRGILIFANPGTAAVATHDGTVVGRGRDARLGRYVQVRDAAGNTYTYARLERLAASHPVPKDGAKQKDERGRADAAKKHSKRSTTTSTPTEPQPGRAVNVAGGSVKERLFANPRRKRAYAAGGSHQVGAPVPKGRDEYVKDLLHLEPKQVEWRRLKPGANVVAGTILGHVGDTGSSRAPHMLFEIRPAGRGAPRIDPKPILDGWKLLESTAIYRAKKENPFFGKDVKAPTIGQVLLMSKESLQKRVLANPQVSIYEQGRLQIRAGQVDRRVLALLEFLSANGLRPGVTSLVRPGAITSSGNVSHHSSGTAVDIASVNGIPMMGNQGKGSITDVSIRRMLNLQGAMKPAQIISLMSYPGTDNTLAMGDHADHIHVGYQPAGDTPSTGKATRFDGAILKPGQWNRVIDRLGEIENPVVLKTPSKASVKVKLKPRKRGAKRSGR